MELSIITVNKNNEAGLEKTIESVVKQTFADYEYIIIDGSSNDRSVDVIRRYAKNIHYWISEPDSGIYNAMNKGIRKAGGRYCLFINSGDYLYDENVLAASVKKFSNADIVYGDLIVFDATQKYHIIYPDELTFLDFYEKSIPHSGGSFIKRNLFEKFGLYNENYKIVSDWEFFIKTVVFGNASTLHVESVFSCFDLKGISTRNLELMHSERRKVLQELIPARILLDYEKLKQDGNDQLRFRQLCSLMLKKIIHIH